MWNYFLGGILSALYWLMEYSFNFTGLIVGIIVPMNEILFTQVLIYKRENSCHLVLINWFIHIITRLLVRHTWLIGYGGKSLM